MRNAVHLSQVNGIFVAWMKFGALLALHVCTRISSGLRLWRFKRATVRLMRCFFIQRWRRASWRLRQLRRTHQRQ